MGKIQMRFTLLYMIFVETAQKIVEASHWTCHFHVGWISSEHDPSSWPFKCNKWQISDYCQHQVARRLMQNTKEKCTWSIHIKPHFFSGFWPKLAYKKSLHKVGPIPADRRP